MKDIYKHQVKYGYFIVIILGQLLTSFAKFAEKTSRKPLGFEDFFLLGEGLVSEIKNLFASRAWSLYVDFKDGEWVSPFDIEIDDAKYMLSFAETYLATIEGICKPLLEAPSELLMELGKYIEEQLIPSFVEELHEKNAIDEEIYSSLRKRLSK